MTTCDICAMHKAGDTSVAAVESIRSQRIMLAWLRDDGADMTSLFAELHDCRDCTARLAVVYLGTSATQLVHICGSTGAAIAAMEHTLAEDLNGQS